MQNHESSRPVNPTASPDHPDEPTPVLDRREALGKLGKLAYTAPVMIAFPLFTRKAAAQECPTPGDEPPCDPPSSF